MKKIEEQLNKLPKARLPIAADLKIRYRIYVMMIKRYGEKITIYKFFTAKRAFALAVVMLLAAIISVPSYAYASPEVVRGNILYPLKRLAEKVELSLPMSAQTKAVVYEKNAARRLAEAEYLSIKNDAKKADYLAATVNDALLDKQKAKEIISSLPQNVPDNKFSDNINESKEKQDSLILKVAQNVGLQADEKVVSAVSKILNVINNEDSRLIENDPAGKQADKLENKSVNRSEAGESSQDVGRKNEKSNQNENIFVRDNAKATTSQKIKTSTEINQAKKNIDELMKTMGPDNLSDEETADLRRQLDSRLKSASRAVDQGNFSQAGELVEESRDLIKNAKFFVKPKFNQKSDDKNGQKGINQIIEIPKDKNSADKNDPDKENDQNNHGRSTSTGNYKNKSIGK